MKFVRSPGVSFARRLNTVSSSREIDWRKINYSSTGVPRKIHVPCAARTALALITNGKRYVTPLAPSALSRIQRVENSFTADRS